MARFSQDTRAAAERFQINVLRRMTPQQRYAIASDLSDSVRDMTLAGLRGRQPGLTSEQLLTRYLQQLSSTRSAERVASSRLR